MSTSVPYGTLGSAEGRFWSKVERKGPDECWPWTAGVMKKTGYGVFHPRKPETKLAHRLAYESRYGPIPVGMHVDHKCHNGQDCPPGPCPHRKCCNPAHLEAVTNAENVNRSHNSNIQKTHCPRGHEYSAGNTYRQPDGGRRCRECARDLDRNYNRTRAGRRALREARAAQHGK